ncbi:MAG: hypothetical protein K9J74_12125 [Sulfuritalea sp.]|nr:hypothetical protein [Sulfuritalea sp.]
MSPHDVETFIANWQDVTASELATAQSFVIWLCRLLYLPAPHATPERPAALADALNSAPQTEQQLAANFTCMGRRKSRLPEIIKAFEALGRARRLDDGRWLG